MPRTDASFSKESLGNWGKPNGLPDQALVLRVRAAKEIITLVVLRRHRTGKNNTQLGNPRPRYATGFINYTNCLRGTRFVTVRVIRVLNSGLVE